MSQTCTFTAHLGDQITFTKQGYLLVLRDGVPMIVFCNTIKVPPKTAKAAVKAGVPDNEVVELGKSLKPNVACKYPTKRLTKMREATTAAFFAAGGTIPEPVEH